MVAGERHPPVPKQCFSNRPDAYERPSLQSICRAPLRNEGDSRNRLTICRASPIMLLTQGRETVPGARASREPSVGARRRRNAGEYVPERGPQRRLRRVGGRRRAGYSAGEFDVPAKGKRRKPFPNGSGTVMCSSPSGICRRAFSYPANLKGVSIQPCRNPNVSPPA